MADRDKIIQFIRLRGPLLPAQINKELDTNILFASAMLSELVDQNILKLSHLKVGGSPVYFAPGQEHRLQNFADKLNEKDKKTYDSLKKNIVLRDSSLDPLTRVSLREIKDFAVPLEVKTEKGTEIFWKWYLTSTADVQERIKASMGIKTPVPQQHVQQKPAQQSIPRQAPKLQPAPLPRPVQKPLPTPVPRVEQPKQDSVKSFEKELNDFKKQVEQQVKKEIEQRFHSKPKDKVKKVESQDKLISPPPVEEPKDKLFIKAKKYFDQNNIVIKSFTVKRKNSDIEFVIEIPSSVGKLIYFCKAKDKKKFNDGDLSSVFIEAQRKKMPVLYLVTGELTKKAQQILETEFKNMSVKKL